MQAGAKMSALRTPFQATTGWGTRHRSAPTGGAAKGRPLNEASPSFTSPCTRPPVMFAYSIAARAEGVAATQTTIMIASRIYEHFIGELWNWGETPASSVTGQDGSLGQPVG